MEPIVLPTGRRKRPAYLPLQAGRMQAPEDLLCEPIFEKAQTWAKFERAFTDDVEDLDLKAAIRTHVFTAGPYKGVKAYELASGIVVTVEKQRFQAWKSTRWFDEREYFSNWNAFVRGSWVSKVPTVEGTYPTRNVDGVRGPDHVFKMVDGKCMDVSGGFVGYGKRTEWMGYFWSLPFPRLKDS